MTLMKLRFILTLVLIESCIHAKLPVFSSLENVSVIYDQMANIMKSCFVQRLNTVIVTPDLVDIFHRTSWGLEPLPVVEIDSDFQGKSSHRGYFPGPATFVLNVDSGKILEKILRLLKSSVWWNNEGLLIIIGEPQQSCKMASEILSTAWKMNLLSSFYLCDQANEGVMLYTYNPYTNRAPHPWTEVENVKKVDERWTMYKQAIVQGRVNCKTLDFDKTKFMDGYKIRAVATPIRANETWIPEKDYDINSLKEKLAFIDAMHSITIFRKLNVTLGVHYDHQGYFRNGTAFGILVKLKKGLYDMILSAEPLDANMSYSYPFFQADVRILTQRGKFLLPVEKISNFYSTGVLYLSSVVALMTFLIMVIRKNREIASAALEILRLALSTNILEPLNTISIRIYLFGVFQLIIILNATFQGNLSAFLTKPERHNIQTIADVEVRHYHLYIPGKSKAALFENWTRLPSQHIHIVEDVDCVKYVLNNTSAACIDYIVVHLQSAEKYGLHLSEASVVRPYMGRWLRDDWPLMNKFNMVSFRLMQSGLVDFWLIKQNHGLLGKLTFREEQETAAQYRPIKLNDLVFAFRLLGIGLTFSTVIFLFEMIPKKRMLLLLRRQRKKSHRKMRACRAILTSGHVPPTSTSSLALETTLRVAPQSPILRRSLKLNAMTVKIHADIHHAGTSSASEQKCPASTAGLEIPSTSRPNAESIISYNIDDIGLSLSDSDVESIQLFN